MSKFKVGDKVTCIETDEKEAADNGITYGKTYRVVGIDKVGLTDLLYLDSGGTAYCYRFKLYEETEMTAEQIRNEILRINSRIEEANKDIENAQNERNSLVEKLREKGFELRSIIPVKSEPVEIPVDYNSLEIGKEYKVKSGNETSYFSDGEAVTITRINVPNATYTVMVQDDCGDDDWMHHSDLCEI